MRNQTLIPNHPKPFRCKLHDILDHLGLWLGILIILTLFLLLTACQRQPKLGVDIPVRIMPMGDSITEGVCDSPDNCNIPWDEIEIPTDGFGLQACSWALNPVNPDAVGYRAFLRDKLTSQGFQVDYVGSVSVVEGLAHEGHWAWRIADIDYCVQNAEWLENAKPDIILLHIGTNDVAGVMEGEKTPDDMAKELTQLLAHIYEKLPNTTSIIVAQLIPASNRFWASQNEVIAQYNALIPGVVDRLRAEGKSVYYVDMSVAIQSDDDFDKLGVHPNTIASEKMANIWLKKLTEILTQNP